MKNCQFFLKGISFLLVASCTSFSPSQKTLDSDPSKVNDFNSIRKLYCAGQKQVKEFKFSFTEHNMKFKSGIPTSVIASVQNQREKERQCNYKKALFELTRKDSVSHGFMEVSQDLYKEISDGSMGTVNPDSLRANCRLYNLFVQSPLQKTDYFVVQQCSGDGGTFYSDSSSNFYRWNSYSFRIPHLTTLIDNFAILEPIEFQTKTYIETEEKTNDCSESKVDKEVLGYDSKNEFNSELAIDYKDQVWKRYIIHFTRIKESHQDDGSKVELTLDLNPFCKYGRSINDLSSR